NSLPGSHAMSPAAAIRTPLTFAWDAVSARVAADAFWRGETVGTPRTRTAHAAITVEARAMRRLTVSPYAASAVPYSKRQGSPAANDLRIRRGGTNRGNTCRPARNT